MRLEVAGIDRSASESEVAAAVRSGIAPTERARRAAIEGAVEEAAQSGLDAGPEVASAAFNELGVTEPIGPARALELATAHLTGERAVGGVRLSARLHATQEANIAAMSGELHQTMHAGLSVERAAQRLLEVDDAVVELPAYIRNIRDAVRLGDQVRLHAVIDAHVAQVEGLDDPTLRAAGREFIRRARDATAQDLDRQIGYWVRDRALYSERVVARTEAARVHAAAFVESTKEQPWVKGYRWELSPSHPKPDVCDLYANQAIDGLGPGGYLAESLPQLPAHPSCLCFTTAIIDDQHYERELAALQGTDAPSEEWRSSEHETAGAWLGRQPEGFQRDVLGLGRLAVFRIDPSRVIGSRGRIAPLWQALGDPRPAPRVGIERVRAARLDPFGEAGSRSPRQPAPAPPAAAPPPATAQASRARLAATLRRVGADGDATGDVRRAARQWLTSQYPDLRARPGLEREAEIVVFDGPAGHRGSYDPPTGRILIERRVWRDLRAGAERLTHGEALTPNHVQALRTLLHEETHHHTTLTGRAYREVGLVLEESLVEMHALDAVERLLEAPAGSLASVSYPEYVELVERAVAGVPGEGNVRQRAMSAARVVWQGEPINTWAEYERRFTEAVGVPEDEDARLDFSARLLGWDG